jgi:hypothetical protein
LKHDEQPLVPNVCRFSFSHLVLSVAVVGPLLAELPVGFRIAFGMPQPSSWRLWNSNSKGAGNPAGIVEYH